MKQIETAHHIEVVKYLRGLKARGKIVSFFAAINEGRALPKDERKRKAILIKEHNLGKHSGVSDLTIVFKDKVLFLEMKQPMKKLKSGKMSNSHSKQSLKQIEFEKEINQSDVCFYEVGYGYAHAKKIIDEYFSNTKQK